MLTLEQIIRVANKKRAKLGIKVSENNYHPAFKAKTKIVLIEDSPFILEVIDGGTKITPYFK